MCRLLGYATAGFNLSLNAVLGRDNVGDFRELSEIHNDGWGVAQLSDPAEAPHVRDDNGDSAGVVVSSSGYEQEGWNVLENDQMIIASNRNGTYRLRSI